MQFTIIELMIGTLVLGWWSVIFGKTRRDLRDWSLLPVGALPPRSPLCAVQCNSLPSARQCINFLLSDL